MALCVAHLVAGSRPAAAYDPDALTGPGFLALASGRTISGWLTEGERVFYLRLGGDKSYRLDVPAQNGFSEVSDRGRVRVTKDHYCLAPVTGGAERCYRVRVLPDNEFESTTDQGVRVARWWLAQ